MPEIEPYAGQLDIERFHPQVGRVLSFHNVEKMS